MTYFQWDKSPLTAIGYNSCDQLGALHILRTVHTYIVLLVLQRIRVNPALLYSVIRILNPYGVLSTECSVLCTPYLRIIRVVLSESAIVA